jgi:hypothetical protein
MTHAWSVYRRTQAAQAGVKFVVTVYRENTLAALISSFNRNAKKNFENRGDVLWRKRLNATFGAGLVDRINTEQHRYGRARLSKPALTTVQQPATTTSSLAASHLAGESLAVDSHSRSCLREVGVGVWAQVLRGYQGGACHEESSATVQVQRHRVQSL